MNTSRTPNAGTKDPFAPYTIGIEPSRLVEVALPAGWQVRVVEGTEFQVRLSPLDAEAEDEAEGSSSGGNVSPPQSRSGSG